MQALAELGTPAWLVGGAVRDRLLRRPTSDFDVVVAGDVAGSARGVARGARGHAFELSEAFGAWRVVAHDRSWQLDLMALEGATIEQDLARRDLTVNAIAEPLDGGDHVDPVGGIADLDDRILRAVSGAAFLDDPLRVMRLARLACELNFEIELGTGSLEVFFTYFRWAGPLVRRPGRAMTHSRPLARKAGCAYRQYQ